MSNLITQRLKKLMKDSGYTVETLAFDLGLPVTRVQRATDGVDPLDYALLHDFAFHFRRRPTSIFRNVDDVDDLPTGQQGPLATLNNIFAVEMARQPALPDARRLFKRVFEGPDGTKRRNMHEVGRDKIEAILDDLTR